MGLVLQHDNSSRESIQSRRRQGHVHHRAGVVSCRPRAKTSRARAFLLALLLLLLLLQGKTMNPRPPHKMLPHLLLVPPRDPPAPKKSADYVEGGEVKAIMGREGGRVGGGEITQLPCATAVQHIETFKYSHA